MSEENPRDAIFRRLAEIEAEKQAERVKQLLEEEVKLKANEKYIKGTKSTTEMMEQVDTTAQGDNIKEADDSIGGLDVGFGNLKGLLDVFEPVFVTINGLLDLFVGSMMESMKPAFEELFKVLGSEGVKDAITNIASIFSSVITPIVQGIADFTKLVITGVPPEDAGGAIGTIVGGIAGAAIASFIGMPILGGIIGAYIGGLVGGASEEDVEDLSYGVQFGGFTLAEGGVVTESIIANVGEAGPEAIIPLDEFDNMFSNNNDEGLELIKSALMAQNRMLTMNTGIQRRRLG